MAKVNSVPVPFKGDKITQSLKRFARSAYMKKRFYLNVIKNLTLIHKKVLI